MLPQNSSIFRVTWHKKSRPWLNKAVLKKGDVVVDCPLQTCKSIQHYPLRFASPLPPPPPSLSYGKSPPASSARATNSIPGVSDMRNAHINSGRATPVNVDSNPPLELDTFYHHPIDLQIPSFDLTRIPGITPDAGVPAGHHFVVGMRRQCS